MILIASFGNYRTEKISHWVTKFLVGVAIQQLLFLGLFKFACWVLIFLRFFQPTIGPTDKKYTKLTAFKLLTIIMLQYNYLNTLYRNSWADYFTHINYKIYWFDSCSTKSFKPTLLNCFSISPCICN